MPGPPSVIGRRRSVTEVMAQRGHEQIVYVRDAEAELDAVIAIHSTVLGPALGGVRFWDYPSIADAALDALALAEAMTRKAALAGLHQGGAKAVVRWPDPDRPHPEAMLRSLGRAVDALGGRYLAAEDVGASTRDMDALALETPWVTGVSEAAGGSGDPSPITALGVVAAMRAALHAVDGDRSLVGRRVTIQGAGHVGTHLARLLADEGARVVVADVAGARAETLAEEVDGTVVSDEHAVTTDCDVLAPCALGGVIDADVVAALRCRAVVGAANNQLDGAGVDRALAARGIVHVPDFVASAGGIINIAEEFTGYDRSRALARAARIEDTTTAVLRRASDLGVTPTRAAEQLARARLEREGSGRRWEPGDAAAWTAGRPLQRLRP